MYFKKQGILGHVRIMRIHDHIKANWIWRSHSSKRITSNISELVLFIVISAKVKIRRVQSKHLKCKAHQFKTTISLRFDVVGIYVVMFLEILHTLIRVLMIFSILIIAFGLAFYILLSDANHKSFNEIPISLMRTFSMMLGDMDFVNSKENMFFHYKMKNRLIVMSY